MSILSGGALFIGDALRVSFTAPTQQANGKGYTADGRICVVNAAPEYFANGLGFRSSTNPTRVCTVPKASAAAPTQASLGLLYDANGRVVNVDVGLAVAPFSYSNGLTFDAGGALVTTTA